MVTRPGYTLVELTISLLLANLLSLGMVSAYFHATRNYQHTVLSHRLQANLSLVVQQVRRSIHRSGYVGLSLAYTLPSLSKTFPEGSVTLDNSEPQSQLTVRYMAEDGDTDCLNRPLWRATRVTEIFYVKNKRLKCQSRMMPTHEKESRLTGTLATNVKQFQAHWHFSNKQQILSSSPPYIHPNAIYLTMTLEKNKLQRQWEGLTSLKAYHAKPE